MANSTSRKNIPGWLAPVAILLGLVSIVAGFGLLTWRPGSVSASGRTTSLAGVAPPTAIQLPTLALMVTSAPTPLLTPVAKHPVSLAETGATFTLTIVHSNDTWGYTEPCG
jgi:hypothetical protein